MKKILFALSAVALLFATSCKKDQNAPENPTLGEGEFLATIDNGANPQNAPVVKDGMTTKTTINTDRYVIWEGGDQISVNNAIYITDMTGSSVKFVPAPEQPSQIASVEEAGNFAFYPSSITKANQVLPATQTIEYDGDDNLRVSNLPMYAFSENNQLTFHNICAALKITVPVACNSIVVSADENICGEFTVDNTTYTAQLAGTGEHLGKTLTVSRSTGSFVANETIYVAVPANTYHNFTIQCKDAQNQVVFAKVIESTTVAVNKVYNPTLSAASVPADCFCFTSVSTTGSATISLDNPSGGDTPEVNLEYCKYIASTGAYTKWETCTICIPVTLDNYGDKVYFRADATGNTRFSINNYNSGKKFTATGGNVTVSGNIMYLLSQTPATALTTDANNYAFPFLFNGITNLTDASGLILPNTVSEYCYSGMFWGCTALTAAPVLRAPTLANSCYVNMFYSCTNLASVTMLAECSNVVDMMNLSNWLANAGTAATSPKIYVCNQGTKTNLETSGSSFGAKPANWSVVVYTAPSPIRRK